MVSVLSSFLRVLITERAWCFLPSLIFKEIHCVSFLRLVTNYHKFDGLKWYKFNFLIILEARSPIVCPGMKSRCWQVSAPSGDSGENLFLASCNHEWLAACRLGLVATSLQPVPLWSHCLLFYVYRLFLSASLLYGHLWLHSVHTWIMQAVVPHCKILNHTCIHSPWKKPTLEEMGAEFEY